MALSDLAARIAGKAASKLHEMAYSPKGATHPQTADVSGIIGFLRDAGMGPGSTIMIHSSWQRLDNDKIKVRPLIEGLLQLVGPQGTIAMPAFPANQDPSTGFSVKGTPSGAGLLTEAFRRYPGVRRSINLNHSVCAVGLHAEFLTKDHHHSVTSWDEHSPYMRLREIGPDAWSVGLGVGWRLKTATALHCADSALRAEVPYFKNMFRDWIEYRYTDAAGGTGTHRFLARNGQIFPPKLARHFTSDELIERCVNGLDVYAIRATTLIDKAIELGRTGKTMYVWPPPWPWLFARS